MKRQKYLHSEFETEKEVTELLIHLKQIRHNIK